MTFTPITAAEASLATLRPVLAGLTTEDREKQTPCDGFTSHELAEHLFGSMVGLGAMGGATVTKPESGSLEEIVTSMATQAIDGWKARGLDGEVEGPGGRMVPAAFGPLVINLELLLHAWDFAQASGQHVDADDALVAYVSEAARGVIDGGRKGGAFGPEVEAPADASALDKLAAYSGRSPLA